MARIAQIVSTARYLPPHLVSNAELTERFTALGRPHVIDKLAAKAAGWGDPLPKRKMAAASPPNGQIKVDRVVCAVDCGTPINPDVIAAQMEGGIGFGLGAALYGTITMKDGKVEQANFDGYQVLRIDEMPKVEVHIVPSPEAPTGVGEPGVAPGGPAVANAVFAATGKRLRVLPFAVGGTA